MVWWGCLKLCSTCSSFDLKSQELRCEELKLCVGPLAKI